MNSKSKIYITLAVLISSLLACRPIIAIGWTEIIIIVVLILVLLGPFLFRVYRFIDKVQKTSKNEKKK